jgi:hypothetical protein
MCMHRSWREEERARQVKRDEPVRDPFEDEPKPKPPTPVAHEPEPESEDRSETEKVPAGV